MPPQDLPSERLPVVLIAGGFAIAYGLFGVFRHRHFGSGFDLAIFDQAVWHMSRFETPASSVSGYANILGDHFYPILALFAPLYWIAPSPDTLIVAQAILLAASIVPVFLFIRARLTFAASMALTVAYGLFWGMQRTAAADVHEMAFAPLLIATALLAIDRRRWWMLWTACVALLAVKEDVVPMVAAFGAYLVVKGERRQGVALAALGVIAFGAIVAVIIPAFTDGRWSTGNAYEAVRQRPWTAPLVLVTPPQKLLTVVYWLAPFALLPVLSPMSALLIPVAAERLLSDLSNHWGPNFHYSAPLAPILAMSAGDGLAKLLARLRDARMRTRVRTSVLSVSLILAAVLPGHQPLWQILQPGHYEDLPVHEIGARALTMIPPEASVVAQAAVAPHLSQREHIYVLGPDAPDADFVIASLDLSPWPGNTRDDVGSLVSDRQRHGYVTVFEEGGWLVLRR